MAVSPNAYPGRFVHLAIPSHIALTASGYDLLTLSLLSGATDDILVLRDGTTERLVVEDGGNVVLTQGAAGDVGLKILRASTPTASAIQVTTNDGSTERFRVGADGNIIVTQAAAATVGLKVLRASTPTSSAIQVTDNGGTAQFSVTKNYGVLWKVRTTRPTTGLTKGEMFIAFHGSSPKICICTSTAAQTVKQVRARTKTFGRLTA